LRLIEIQPAVKNNDPIVCTLTEATFGSKPQYEALSYMWKKETADEPILLNGVPFVVGKNLRDALLFLRRDYKRGSTKTRLLIWIDAICINQREPQERNRQVRIMDQIYFRAQAVVVWL
ncbi:heterokaryon incompatibility protein-domain-containing protein, partial [Immersiella caudata]